MINRRHVLGLAAVLALGAGPAVAEDWKSMYSEIVFAAVPDENAEGMTARYTPFMDYLSRELGVPVTLRIANDYAAVIEGQKAKNIHIAQYGPASYARAYLVGAEIEPFAIMVNADGTKGYYSVFYVKADSPYQSIDDLKGKNLCLVDPNSTSGNNVPRYALDKMGITPEEYFGNVVYAGSHENAVIGVEQGTCDVAANWWNDEEESNLRRMERKGMAKYDNFRIIFKSDQIVNSPMAYLTEMPDALKQKIADAVMNAATRDPAAWETLTNGKMQPYEPVDHAAYEPVVELIQFVDSLRKRGS